VIKVSLPDLGVLLQAEDLLLCGLVCVCNVKRVTVMSPVKGIFSAIKIQVGGLTKYRWKCRSWKCKALLLSLVQYLEQSVSVQVKI